jgi:hypothetical protein
LIAQSLNQIEGRPQQRDPRQLPRPGRFCHQRRTDCPSRFRRPGHCYGNASSEQLCRPPALAVARPFDGFAAGHGTAAAHSGRGDAASIDRRAGARLRAGADPSQEGSLLRRPAVCEPHPPRTRATPPQRGHLRRPVCHTPTTGAQFRFWSQEVRRHKADRSRLLWRRNFLRRHTRREHSTSLGPKPSLHFSIMSRLSISVHR